MSLKAIDTPCIGICSTIYGDVICRGCKRSYQEVIDWNTYDDIQKQTVLLRLWDNIANACNDKLNIFDVTLLEQQLQKYAIRYNLEQNPLCWTFYILREGHSKIQDLNKYGFGIKPAFQKMSLTEVYEIIDEELS